MSDLIYRNNDLLQNKELAQFLVDSQVYDTKSAGVNFSIGEKTYNIVVLEWKSETENKTETVCVRIMSNDEFYLQHNSAVYDGIAGEDLKNTDLYDKFLSKGNFKPPISPPVFKAEIHKDFKKHFMSYCPSLFPQVEQIQQQQKPDEVIKPKSAGKPFNKQTWLIGLFALGLLAALYVGYNKYYNSSALPEKV